MAPNALEVEIVEVATEAFVPGLDAAEGKSAVVAHSEACSPDGACLGWFVELELLVGCDVTCSAYWIVQDAVNQRNSELGVSLQEVLVRVHN